MLFYNSKPSSILKQKLYFFLNTDLLRNFLFLEGIGFYITVTDLISSVVLKSDVCGKVCFLLFTITMKLIAYFILS